MYKKHQNEAGQSAWLNLAETPVFLRFHFSTRIYGVTFIFCVTDSFEISYN